MTILRTGCALVLLLGLSACKGQQQGAKEYFSRTQSCPLDQVEARSRSDVKHSDFSPWPSPPADIAGDPARLAVWQKNLQEQKDGLDRQSSVYEAKGCGKDVMLACKASKGNASNVTCAEGAVPPGKDKPW